MQQTIEKKFIRKKPFILVLSVLGALLVLLGIAAAMALSDPNRAQSAVKADTGTPLAKLGVAAISGEPARLTAEEVNSLLVERFTARAPRLSLGDDGTVTAYIPVNYKGIRLGVTAAMTIGYDTEKEQVCAEIHSLQLGRLPIAPSFGLRLLKSALPNGVSVKGNTVCADSAVSDSGLLGSVPGLQVSSLEVSGGYFIVGVSGNLGRLHEFIVQALPNVLQNIT